MKKVLLIVIPFVIVGLLIGIIILIPCMLIMNFFGVNTTDGYVEDNFQYASEYTNILNEHLVEMQDGYVSLERILYFYLRNENSNMSEIYKENLDTELKRMKPISSVCETLNKKFYYGCNSDEIKASGQIDEYQNKPFAKPLDFSKIVITSFFMEQRIVNNEFNVHKAWDLASNSKPEVKAVCDGKIIENSFTYKENVPDTAGGYGNYIMLECNDINPKYKVIYGHLFPNSSKVKVGDIVSKNQTIAFVGNTGNSTGDHLHFEVRDDKNKYVDGMSLVSFSDDDIDIPTKDNDYLKPPILK